MFDNKYPYTDFHELNLDWFMGEFKKLVAEWEETKGEWNTLHDYVQNYFENLNVQTEINNKINAMILDGTFADIVSPFVTAALPALVAGQLPDVVAAQISSVVAAQISAVVADQLPAVAAAAAAAEVGDWLTAHIDPDTGYVIDDTLTVQNAAADAKTTGDAIRAIKPPLMSSTATVELEEIDFVQGGYDVYGTFFHTYPNRITSGYLPLKRSASVILNSGSGYQHRCLYFDEKETFIDTTEQLNWHQGEYEYPSASGAKFFRIVVSTVSSEAISPSTDTDTTYSLIEHFTVIDDWNLRGKKISILGDSLSTFGGSVDDPNDTRISPVGNPYTWPGNQCRYPQLNLLTSVNETYWMKIINHFGLVLGINESWAGTCVAWDGTSTTGTFAKENCISAQERINHLDENGTPDIIIVNGGTNDIGRDTPIGTFNTADPMNYTDAQIAALDVTTFANAFRAMLIRLQKTYKNAIIIVVMPNYTSSYYTPSEADAYNEIIKEACDYFGVMWVDARISGVTMFNRAFYLPDGVHYNAAGMELLYTVIKNAIERTYQ